MIDGGEEHRDDQAVTEGEAYRSCPWPRQVAEVDRQRAGVRVLAFPDDEARHQEERHVSGEHHRVAVREVAELEHAVDQREAERAEREHRYRRLAPSPGHPAARRTPQMRKMPIRIQRPTPADEVAEVAAVGANLGTQAIVRCICDRHQAPRYSFPTSSLSSSALGRPLEPVLALGEDVCAVADRRAPGGRSARPAGCRCRSG